MKILAAITALSNIEAKDLDGCSVEELAQFMYWLQAHQGSIFVKSVGRLALMVEEKRKESLDFDREFYNR